MMVRCSPVAHIGVRMRRIERIVVHQLNPVVPGRRRYLHFVITPSLDI
jgi:hypothetical protein